MTAKKILALVLAALMTAAAFAGCSAGTSNKGYAQENAGGAPADGVYESSTDAAPTVTDRKLIRRISLDVETDDLDELISSIDAKVTQLGGYVESRKVNTGSSYSSYKQNRYATLTIRIPAAQLDSFVSHVGSVSNVTATSETSEDVTLSYVATESRMKALQTEEARLLELIEKAANLTELLQLEERLTEIRTELERVTSQLKVYDNLVEYGTISLSVSEVQQFTPTEEPGFWERLSTGFTDSVRNLGIFLTELVIFIVCALPYLVPLGIVIGGVLLLVKLSKRKKTQSEESKEDTK